MSVIENYVFEHSRLSKESFEKTYVWKNLTLRDFFKKNIFFSTSVEMTHWWKNMDVCMDWWMVPIQIMLFQSRRWLLRLWLLRRWLVGTWFLGTWLLRTWLLGTWLLRTWFVGTWLLWTWLLRSYLEPGYTDMVVFNGGDQPKINVLVFFRLFFQLDFRWQIGERTWMYIWMDEWYQVR